MRIRKQLCKSLAKNLAASLLENIEVCWQQENYDISDEEVEYIQKNLAVMAKKIAATVNYQLLKSVKINFPMSDNTLPIS